MTNRISLVLSAVIAALLLGSSQGSSAAGVDEKVVAALDTQYQLAVKGNDAAAMDRILADDFVLVTGNGKHSARRTC